MPETPDSERGTTAVGYGATAKLGYSNGYSRDGGMARREYKTGSIYRRASDGLWIGTLEAGSNTKGGRRRTTVSGKTKAVVQRKLRDKRLAVERDGHTEASARTTVKYYAKTWLADRQTRIRPKPYATDASAVQKWIIPTIGHRRLDELQPADVRAVAPAQRKAGLSTSTARRTHTTLTAMLRAAMLDGHGVPHRVLLVEAPAVAVNDRTDLAVSEAVAMLGVAAEIPQGSRWVAAFLQGMRQAECLGLTWEQVDLDAAVLTVSWQLQELPYRIKRDRASGFRVPDGFEARQLHGRWHLVRPKTKAGWRVIPLVPWMTTALRTWREASWDSPHGLVWPVLDGGPCDPKLDMAEWYVLQETVGVRHPTGRAYTMHEARHTTATLLLEAGIDPAVITAILGHSKIVTSRGYMHVNTKPLQDALGRVAERLELG